MKEYSENYKTAKALYGYYCNLVKGGRNDQETLDKLLEVSGRYEASKDEYWATYAAIKAEEMKLREEARKSARTVLMAAKVEKVSRPSRPSRPPRPPAPPAPPATEKVEWTPTPLLWD